MILLDHVYLLAGIAVSSHTPGFQADQNLATEMAEVGVILPDFKAYQP